MSHKVVKWALDLEGLRPLVKLVLVALGDRASHDGDNCRPGISELAKRASTSRRRVVAAIEELEAVGAITVTRSRKPGSKARATNRYQVHVGRALKAACQVPPEGADAVGGIAPHVTTAGTQPRWGQQGTRVVPPVIRELPLNDH
jgi:Helix-turn-helix domain